MKRKKVSRTRKLIIQIWILILILLLLVIVLLLLSEKVYKIGIIDNMKEKVTLLAEKMQNTSSKLVLNTKVNLSAANGKGGVDLDWSDYDSTGNVFKVYQKKEESNEWQSISTFNFSSKGEQIKVLNIYPEAGNIVTFKYLDGTTVSLPKSAALKVWIEGGTMNEIPFNAYGINPITGEQIIKVTSISNTDFNNNPNVIWNYDILMVGTWDASGGAFPDDNAIKVIEEYIKSGYSVLAGHDTIGCAYSRNALGLSKLRKYFNIDIGFWESAGNVDLIDYKTSWGYGSSYVSVDKTGLLTNFPYELPIGTKLNVPFTHTCSNAAKGSVWMTFINGTNGFSGQGSTNAYYNVGGKGNPVYYLTTYNNTAMIQTGHSNCESTDDERKVLANTLFYLKQRTITKSSTDNSSQDFKSPDSPTINAVRENKNIKISYNAKDNGSTYSFYVEAYDSKESSIKLATSNQRTETVTTGIKGYYYIIDTDISNKDFSATINGVQYTENPNIILDLLNNGKYIHMKAIDVAGNIGAPSVLKIDVNLDKKLKVILDLKGGILEGEEGPIEQEIIIGDSPELHIPEKEGYKFKGWCLDPEGKKPITVQYIPQEDVTLYAKWEKDYTITVDNEKEGHTYNSYQIFQGDYYEKEEIIIGENGEEKIVKVPILSNIEWSKELQKEAESGKTHGDKIIEILKEKEKDKEEINKLYTNCKTAEDIAKVLQGKPNDGDAIKEFTDIVGKYILENNIPITKGTSTVVEGTDSVGNIDKNYKITHLAPGYYIVIDAKANEKNDAYSRYLIDVVQDVTMEPKTSIPRLKKKVKGNNIKTLVSGIEGESSVEYVEDEKRNTATYKKESEEYNAEDYDIEFELKSYIPDLDGYNTYKFELVDILAKGFDYDRNSVKVMLGKEEYPKAREKVIKAHEELGEENSTEIVDNYTINSVVITVSNYETYKAYFEEEGKEYPEGYAESNYGKTLILIELNDLVELNKEGIISKGQDVIITYNAKLNGKGEVGNIPNINEAYVKYSNDPYHNDKESQTTTQTTYTYTIDLDLIKIADLKDESSILNYLEGAEFEIYNKPETDKDRNLIATIKTDEILDSEGNIINKVGQALYSSLGARIYYIKETKSPEGYNKLREEIEIEVKAVCDEYGEITWMVEEKNNNNLWLAQIGVKEGTDVPEIKLQVENTSGLQLPVTGGTGTTIFIVIGLCIMLVAILILKSIKEKNK